MRRTIALALIVTMPAVAAADEDRDEPDDGDGLAAHSDDPAVERGYLGATALVAPAGTTTVTMQAPLYTFGRVRIDRAFTDRLSLGAGGAGGMMDGNDGIGWLTLHGRYQLWRG